ncbi:hypothetical protein CPA50_09215 [Marinobacter sp. ANT_B65]|nr:hypothetical protein CPA50_09215 [Marinobacter sp. ANT_B65]
MLSTYLSFSLFAFIASITPGPSNLISLAIGTRQGAMAALPFIVGASISMALSSISIFALPGADDLQHTSWLALIFFLIAAPCQLCWSWLGQSAKGMEGFSKREACFNKLLAILLLITVWGALLTT